MDSGSRRIDILVNGFITKKGIKYPFSQYFLLAYIKDSWKLHNSIINILVEAKYLDDAKTMKLTPQSLHPHVKRYLLERDENYIVECLERSK